MGTTTEIIDAGWVWPTGRGKQSGRVILNAATLEELCTLPGIGHGRARRILKWREQNGPFPTTAALLAIEGIGRSTIGRLQNHIR